MTIRTSALWALALASVLLVQASPAQAVDVTVTVSLGSTADDELSDLPNANSQFAAVTVTATEKCRQIQLLTPGAGGGSQSASNTSSATFTVLFSRPQDFTSKDYVVSAECLYAIFGKATSPDVRVPVKKFRPPEKAPPIKKAPAAGSGKRKGAGKQSGGASKKGAPRAAPGTHRLAILPADPATLLAQIAARQFQAAAPLTDVADLPPPTGAVTDLPVPAAPLPTPVLPAALSAAAKADLTALFANLSQQIALGRAAVEALSRRQSAVEAGDAANAARQEVAAADLVDRWANALGAAGGLGPPAQAALVSAGLTPVALSAADLEALKDAARRGQLPVDVQATLASDLAPPRAVASAQTGIIALSASEVAGYTPTVDDPALANLEGAAAAELRDLALALRTPGDAAGTAPVDGRSAAKGIGELKPVGCAARQTPGCAKVPSLLGTAYVAISPDGRQVYVSSRGGGSITVFLRDPISGKLTRAPGKAGCVSATGDNGCAKGNALGGASGMVLSPDGRSLYVAAESSGAIVALSRNARTGALRYVGCVTGDDRRAPGCAKVPSGLGGAKNIALSPDGRHLYVPVYSYNIVQILARNTKTGSLSGIGCIGRVSRGCRLAAHIAGPRGVAVTPDGRSVVIADQDADAVIGFDRDPATGWLTESSCVAGDGTHPAQPGCASGVGLGGPQFIVASARKDEIVVGSSATNSIVLLRRDPASGSLTVSGADSPCVTDRASKSTRLCLGQPGLGATHGIVVSPDGDSVYAASYAPGSVTSFRRDPVTGELVLTGPCWSDSDPLCRKRSGMKRAGHLVLSPDGRHVYVVAPDSDTVTAFARRLAVTKAAVPRGAVRLTKAGTLRVKVSCPGKAATWCAGLLRAKIKGVSSKPAPFVVRPGKTALVLVPMPKARLAKLTGRLSVKLTAVAREPFGASATTRRTSPIKR